MEGGIGSYSEVKTVDRERSMQAQRKSAVSPEYQFDDTQAISTRFLDIASQHKTGQSKQLPFRSDP